MSEFFKRVMECITSDEYSPINLGLMKDTPIDFFIFNGIFHKTVNGVGHRLVYGDLQDTIGTNLLGCYVSKDDATQDVLDKLKHNMESRFPKSDCFICVLDD
jgi:hypothetical protein